MTVTDDEELQSVRTPNTPNTLLTGSSRLAPDAMQALAEFMREKDEQDRRFEELRLQAERDHEDRIVTMADFQEDWNQSQFWYDDETATILAESLLEGATENTAIALVSAPTVYVKLREWKTTGRIPRNMTIKLLEYDSRFAVFKEDFVYYDFEYPLRGLPKDLRGRFDRVMVDPPFLSDDCQTKTALTVRWLTKPWTLPPPIPDKDSLRIMMCTGERMRDLLMKLYRQAGLKRTDLDVRHSKGLSNEFWCYSNLPSAHFKLLKEEA